jgi:hypothetical protein
VPSNRLLAEPRISCRDFVQLRYPSSLLPVPRMGAKRVLEGLEHELDPAPSTNYESIRPIFVEFTEISRREMKTTDQ